MSCVSWGRRPVSSVSTRKSGRSVETRSMITDASAVKLATIATREKLLYVQRSASSGLASGSKSTRATRLIAPPAQPTGNFLTRLAPDVSNRRFQRHFWCQTCRIALAWSCGLLLSRAQRVEPNPLDPVAETFAGVSLRAELHEDRAQEVDDFVDRHVRGIHAVEPGTFEIPSQHHVVLAERGADKADVAEIRAGAAVGAAAHPEADALLGQADLVEHRGDLSNQSGEHALG